MRRFLIVLLLGCGGSAPRTRELATAPAVDAGADASPDAAPDADDGTAAAVVPPDDEPTPALEDVDTTLAGDDLPAQPTGWVQQKVVKRGGGQLLALFVREGKLRLSIVEDQNGIVQDFVVAAVDGATHPNNEIDGEAYRPRERVAGYQGPILFAIRVRGPDHVWQQVVVYQAGATVQVVLRPLGTSEWTRKLRVVFGPDATFTAIGTTDPH